MTREQSDSAAVAPEGAGGVAPAPRRVGRRYHAHLPGGVYVLTTVVLVIGALNGQNNLLFALFGLAVGGLVVSGLLSGANLMGISVERLPPPNGAVGQTAFVRYRVRNRNWLLPAFAITIEEAPPSRGWFRRPARDAAPPVSAPVRAFAPYVPARGSIVVEGACVGLRRGVLRLNRMRALSTFPFGLTKKSVLFEQAHDIRIRPAPAPVRRGLLRAAGGEARRGGRLRRWRGGEEFWALREFSPGDSLRSVAWRPTARFGQVLVRDSAQAAAERFWIEIDTAGADAAAVEMAVSVAAGLFVRGHEEGCPVGLRIRDGGVLAPIRTGRTHVGEVLDALAVWSGRGGGTQTPPEAGRRAAVVTVSAVGGGSAVTGRVWAGDPSILTAEFTPFGTPPGSGVLL